MSAETKAALDAALQAHIADETNGSIVTGYVLLASNQDIEKLDQEVTGYWREVYTHQAMHTTVGLAVLLADQLREDAITCRP